MTAPAPVQRAARLMLGGAIGSFVWGLDLAVVTLAFKTDTINYYVKTQHVTASQASAEFYTVVFLVGVEAVIGSSLWW